MKGLIIKDLLNLKKQFRTTLLALLAFIVMSFNSGNPSLIISMSALLGVSMTISSMSYDEFFKWNSYALAMPISRKKLVLSKYILSILLIVPSLLLSTLISYLFILPKSNMIAKDLLATAYIVLGLFILYICIMIPFIYKFGVEKSRLLIIAITAIITGTFFTLNSLDISLPSEDQLMTFLKLSPLLLIIALTVSTYISYSIMKKKDL